MRAQWGVAEGAAFPSESAPFAPRETAEQPLPGPDRGRRTLQCPYCPYTSRLSNNLRTHIRVHTGEKPFACPHCPYRTAHSSDLKSHARKHTGEKPYACPHCSYRANISSNLTRHVRSRHPHHTALLRPPPPPPQPPLGRDPDDALHERHELT